MDNLDVFRLSAEAFGYSPDPQQVVLNPLGLWAWNLDKREYFWWNPFTNAEQRWQCVEKLLEMGSFGEWGKNHGRFLPYGGEWVNFNCSAYEFPARALAELQRRKNG